MAFKIYNKITKPASREPGIFTPNAIQDLITFNIDAAAKGVTDTDDEWTGGFNTLSGLSDTTIDTPANTEYLKYSTTTGTWVNELLNIIEDTSPTLGATLDANGKPINGWSILRGQEGSSFLTTGNTINDLLYIQGWNPFIGQQVTVATVISGSSALDDPDQWPHLDLAIGTTVGGELLSVYTDAKAQDAALQNVVDSDSITWFYDTGPNTLRGDVDVYGAGAIIIDPTNGIQLSGDPGAGGHNPGSFYGKSVLTEGGTFGFHYLINNLLGTRTEFNLAASNGTFIFQEDDDIVVFDTSPTLGGNLDANIKNISNYGQIKGKLDATSFITTGDSNLSVLAIQGWRGTPGQHQSVITVTGGAGGPSIDLAADATIGGTYQIASLNDIPTVYDTAITFTAGDGIKYSSGNGIFNLNQASTETFVLAVDHTVGALEVDGTTKKLQLTGETGGVGLKQAFGKDGNGDFGFYNFIDLLVGTKDEFNLALSNGTFIYRNEDIVQYDPSPTLAASLDAGGFNITGWNTLQGLSAVTQSSIQTGQFAGANIVLRGWNSVSLTYKTVATITEGNTPTFDLMLGTTLNGSEILTDATAVTDVTGGLGIASTGGNTPDISFAITEFSTAILVETDYILFQDVTDNSTKRQLASTVNLSQFNNDAVWTTNVGTVTGTGTATYVSYWDTGTSQAGEAGFTYNATRLTVPLLTVTSIPATGDLSMGFVMETAGETRSFTPGGLTPSGTNFLSGDGTWKEAGTGDVSKVGTPVDNQVGVWTGDGTLEGDASLRFAQDAGENILTIRSATSTVDSVLEVQMTSTTGTAAPYIQIYHVGGAGSTNNGDAFYRIVDGSARSWMWGMDVNVDEDFHLGTAADATARPSAYINGFSIDTTGLFTFNANVGGGGIVNFLRADGQWADPGSGSGTVTSVSILAGTDITQSGSPITTSGSITVNHADTSTLSGTYGSTASNVKIDNITVDGRGHVTAITTGDAGLWSTQASGIYYATDVAIGATAMSGTERLRVDGGTGPAILTESGLGSWALLQYGTGNTYLGTQVVSANEVRIYGGSGASDNVDMAFYTASAGTESEVLRITYNKNLILSGNATHEEPVFTMDSDSTLDYYPYIEWEKGGVRGMYIGFEANSAGVSTQNGGYLTQTLEDTGFIARGNTTTGEAYYRMTASATNPYWDIGRVRWIGMTPDGTSSYGNFNGTKYHGIDCPDINNINIKSYDSVSIHLDTNNNGTNSYFNIGQNSLTPTITFRVSGAGVVDAASNIIGYSTSVSDIRLKENIVRTDPQMSYDKVMQLSGIRFNYKERNRDHIGYVAQEVEDIFPELIDRYKHMRLNDDVDYLMIRSTEMMPYITDALQVVAHKAETNEEKIKRLEKRVTELETQL